MKKAVKMWLIFVTAFLIGATLSEMMPSLLYAYGGQVANNHVLDPALHLHPVNALAQVVPVLAIA
ncbi:hypothetical protein [Fervidibacter sacchari]